jgi:hypothetical protein
MEVPMYVRPESAKTVRVDRDVRQDYFVTLTVLLDNVGSDVVEVRQVLADLEDVMVALDEYKPAIKTRKLMDITRLDTYVTKEIHSIRLSDEFVMSPDDLIVMFLNGFEVSPSY